MKPKHTNSLISLFSLWYEGKNIHPLFLLSLRPVAPTTLVLLCAFFMFFIQKAVHKACSRNFSLSPPIHLATEM